MHFAASMPSILALSVVPKALDFATVRLVQKRQNWRKPYLLYLLFDYKNILDINLNLIFFTRYFGCYGNNLQPNPLTTAKLAIF